MRIRSPRPLVRRSDVRLRHPAFRSLCAVALILSATGCTRLSVTPDRIRSDGQGKALSGVSYALPMLQYDLKTTRTLTGCPAEVEWAPGVYVGSLALSLEVEAKPEAIEGERYRINYSKLDSWMKTTSFTIEYHANSELLKSVNVSIEDKSGEVIGNVVKAGLAVAAVASGPAGMGATAAGLNMTLPAGNASFIKSLGFESDALQGSPGDVRAAVRKLMDNAQSELRRVVEDSATAPQPIIACTGMAERNVTDRKAALTLLKAQNKELKDAKGVVDELTKLAAVRALAQPDRAKLVAAAEALLAATDKVAGTQEQIDNLEKALGVEQDERWPRTFSGGATSEVAALDLDDRKTLSELIELRTVRVVDSATLARKLAAHPQLAMFRLIAKEFVDSYVDGTSPRAFKSVPDFAGCRGAAADNMTCLNSMATLKATLRPVATDQLEDCKAGEVTEPGAATECRALWGDERRAAELRQKAKNENNGRDRSLPEQVDARHGIAQDGLFVRPPVRAVLVVCRAASVTETTIKDGCAKGADTLVKDDKILAPQLGQLRYFRLVNQMFSNNGLVLILNKEGGIEKFQYASTKSIAQGLSAAAADAATQGQAFDKQRREDYAKNTDPVAQLQKQIDLRTAQDKLAAFDRISSPSALELLQRAKLQAEVDLLTAQASIAAAQAAIYASRALEP